MQSNKIPFPFSIYIFGVFEYFFLKALNEKLLPHFLYLCFVRKMFRFYVLFSCKEKTLDKPFCVYYFLENQHIRVYKKRYVLKEKFSNLTFWSDKTLKGIDNKLN